MKAAVKPAIETILLGTGVARLRRATLRSRAVVLAYHNVVPAGEPVCGDRSLHLPQAAFARQLDALLRTHDVVPLDVVLAPPRRADRPRAVITFDDAYRGAVTAGVAELVRRGLPATIFVAPSFVGGGTFWWDRLAAGRPDGLDPGFRDHALHVLRGRSDAVDTSARATGYRPQPLPSHAAVAAEDELRAAAAQPGIVLGSHSWSHSNLAALDAADLDDELERPLQWLRQRFERVSDWISYPYGMSTPEVEAAARRAGYRGGLWVEGGWLAPGTRNEFSLPRLNIPSSLSTRGFALRVSGLFCG
jgi:peptidoglycan/xylan/chitin deacetylase (PgdA/CDA1 family)